MWTVGETGPEPETTTFVWRMHAPPGGIAFVGHVQSQPSSDVLNPADRAREKTAEMANGVEFVQPTVMVAASPGEGRGRGAMPIDGRLSASTKALISSTSSLFSSKTFQAAAEHSNVSDAERNERYVETGTRHSTFVEENGAMAFVVANSETDARTSPLYCNQSTENATATVPVVSVAFVTETHHRRSLPNGTCSSKENEKPSSARVIGVNANNGRRKRNGVFMVLCIVM